METTESLSRAAMDTLSSRIAVLDQDGTILFTNSAWQAFAESSDAEGSSDMRGVNYFDSIDPEGDAYAGSAIEGIKSVLSRERDQFELEYPCHTPEEKQWFMMRATPFSIGRDDFVTVAHIDITDRRLAELDAQAHAERAERERRNLEHLVDRINGLIQDITLLLVDATTRGEIEEGVCRRLADADPYVLAWIGRASVRDDALAVETAAGQVERLDRDDRPLSPDSTDPSVRALLEEEVTVAELAGDDGSPAAMMAIPLLTREADYGVLVVYADDPDAFDEREQVVLEALGRATANAINAVENRRTLTADYVVELEFDVEDADLFECRLSAATGGSFAYSGSVYRNGGALQMFFTGSEVDAETVLQFAEEDDDVEDVALLAAYDDEALFQFTVADPLVVTLVDRGAVTREIATTDGVARFTVELPRDADARSVFGELEDRYERTELVGYHEHERPVQTRQEFRADLEDRLTERQLTALRTAYHSGFFDWPRRVDGDELAATMDISRSTFHQHLRVAERKVLEAFFERS